MSKHELAAKLGRRTGRQIISNMLEDKHDTHMCPVCYAGNMSIEMLSTALAASEFSQAAIVAYLEEVINSIYNEAESKRKEAGHEDPPKSPDKRKLI